jgi:hypothetical protein
MFFKFKNLFKEGGVFYLTSSVLIINSFNIFYYNFASKIKLNLHLDYTGGVVNDVEYSVINIEINNIFNNNSAAQSKL